MRMAIVSDIHGNGTALRAVLSDLRDTSPDVIFHGGDLADMGSSPAEVVDQIRDLGWPGVLGNTDEIHTRPESLNEYAGQSSAPPAIWAAVRETAEATRAMLGEQRIAWMRGLPEIQRHDSMALLHASPQSLWRSPGPEANDAELHHTYAPVLSARLADELVVFGHVHRPFIRRISAPDHEWTIANTGSVGLPYDGDDRAAYLLIDNGVPAIRRVAYDVEAEVQSLASCGLPHADWIVKMLRTGSPQAL